MKNLITQKYDYFKARRAAKKYKLDFDHRCVFSHQLSYKYPCRKSGENGCLLVKMKSGKTGMYQESITRWYGTGQSDYHFKFIGYK